MKKLISTFLMGFVFVSLAACSSSKEEKGSAEFITEAPRELKPFLTDQIANLDETKPTLCTITINSEDERELFQENLGEDFNFIELVDENNKYWFEDSCNSKIKCDVMVVSGHFGGSFFGKSKHELSAKTLESNACNNYCNGILKAPKEVFLFGCNTTAGKKADGRTPEQYADILYNEHRDVYRTREMAELHAAFRYSPIGSETQEKMQRVFSNSKIYGFYSKSPTGQNIRPRLRRYFKGISNYLNHILNFSVEAVNKSWNRSMKGQYIRTVEGSDQLESPLCILGSADSDLKKLTWIEKVLLEEEKILAYSTEISTFLVRLEKKFGKNSRKWPLAERAYILRFSNYTGSKEKVDDFLQAPFNGILSAQLDVLRLAERFLWYTSAESIEVKKGLLDGIFKKDLTSEKRKQICSTGVSLNLTLKDLPRKKRWNNSTLEALGCVKPKAKRVQLRMLDGLSKNRKPYIRDRMRKIFRALVPYDDEVRDAIAKAMAVEAKLKRRQHRSR